MEKKLSVEGKIRSGIVPFGQGTNLVVTRLVPSCFESYFDLGEKIGLVGTNHVADRTTTREGSMAAEGEIGRKKTVVESD